MGLANCLRELGYTMTACLKEDASGCMAWQHVWDLVNYNTLRSSILHCNTGQGRLNLDKVTTTEHSAEHHDKTLFIPDVVNLCSKNWLDEMCKGSLHPRIRANGSAMLERLSYQTSMIICDGTSSVENLTSFQYLASGTCRYLFGTPWHVGCCVSQHPKGVRGRV